MALACPALLSPALQAYAMGIVPLLFAPELDGRPGALFNQAGDAILPSKQLTEPATIASIMKTSRELIARALAAGGSK